MSRHDKWKEKAIANGLKEIHIWVPLQERHKVYAYAKKVRDKYLKSIKNKNNEEK